MKENLRACSLQNTPHSKKCILYQAQLFHLCSYIINRKINPFKYIFERALIDITFATNRSFINDVTLQEGDGPQYELWGGGELTHSMSHLKYENKVGNFKLQETQ